MHSKRDVLISTVGTSLFSNIENISHEDPLKIEKEKGNWIGLSKRLLKKPCEDKVYGAEINSIACFSAVLEF